MRHDQLTIGEEAALEIERWFSETHKDSGRSLEEVQLLILYKLQQIEERLKVVEEQTRTHWSN